MSRRVYTGGKIITMEENVNAEWIVCENGVITETGTGSAPCLPGDEIVDLAGRTLLPGFIDAHSHLCAVANTFLQVNLEGADSVSGVLDRIEAFIEDNGVKSGTWINAAGYDNNLFPGKTHITAKEIDSRFFDYPVVIQNRSGHMGTFNALAMKLLNVNGSTQPMAGGHIEKTDGEPTGYMEENDFVERLKRIPMAGLNEMLMAFEKAQDVYLKNGVTTVQEGMLAGQLMPIYKAASESGTLKMDVVGYPDMGSYGIYENEMPESMGKYRGHFKVGGVKTILDGSPQGKTAWMRNPYEGEDSYTGYPSVSDDELLNIIKFTTEKKCQLLAHCNGDRAAEQFITQAKKVTGLYRPVLIHGQLLGRDQLEDVKKLGIIPSFFIAHVYHWGDIHVENFGKERAEHISPAGSAEKRDIVFTFHQDSPVVMPDMLETVWCAVVRQRKSGKVLGADERISPFNALRAVTINAAYQYGEEDKKGSVVPGKLENFAILDKDPTAVPAEEIKSIRVMETIIGGKVMYRASMT